MRAIIKYFLKTFDRSLDGLKVFFNGNPKAIIGVSMLTVFGLVFITSKMTEHEKIIYRENSKPVFSKGRILGSQTLSFLRDKEMLLSKTARKIMAQNTALTLKVDRLEKRIEAKF